MKKLFSLFKSKFSSKPEPVIDANFIESKERAYNKVLSSIEGAISPLHFKTIDQLLLRYTSRYGADSPCALDLRERIQERQGKLCLELY
jgi:hypothetical protein